MREESERKRKGWRKEKIEGEREGWKERVQLLYY